MWGGCFSSVDCLLIHFRQVDEPRNAIIAGAVTGGVLAIRSGPQAAAKQAFIGGLMLGLIEGAQMIMTSMSYRWQ